MALAQSSRHGGGKQRCKGTQEAKSTLPLKPGPGGSKKESSRNQDRYTNILVKS